MPKRRRLLTPVKSRGRPSQSNVNKEQEAIKAVPEKPETTPRGRLKGALLDALDADESDTSLEPTPVKKERYVSPARSTHEGTSEEEDKDDTDQSPPRQSYVLKLFDRSVDLSQFKEDSPLYPICRAWIANQPKANYKSFGSKKIKKLQPSEESMELPGPEGPAISRIPNLLPEQMERSKDNINLNYREAPPTRAALLAWHARRWAGVRAAWLARAAQVEARYSAAQRALNHINLSAI